MYAPGSTFGPQSSGWEPSLFQFIKCKSEKLKIPKILTNFTDLIDVPLTFSLIREEIIGFMLSINIGHFS